MKRFLLLLASCASACAAPTIGGPTIGGSTPVQYATQAEANAGTLTNKAISPSTLSAYSLNQSTGSISSIVATNISAYQALLATQNLHTIIEPLRIHHTSVDWIFDILSGGGNDLEISQSSGPVLISIDDSGNITARSGYYSGNGSGLTNVIPASMRSTNTPGVGQTYYSINGTNGYWGAASSGTTYTNNVTGLPGVVLGAGIGSNYSSVLTIAYTASTNFSRDAANLVTGTIPPARLGTGTPDSTKYLRGDSSWVTLGTFASQTPWGSEIDGNYNSLINVDTIYGLDGAHGSDLSLHSYDSDATIKLYTFDSGNGIRYASQNGHTFRGPVTFLDGVSGGDWSIATLSVSSAYVGVTNATALGTDATGKLVAGSGQVAGNVFGDRAVWNGSAWEDDSRWIHAENEFLLAASVGYPMAVFGTGTGAGINAVDTTSNRVGVVTVAPGTTATGYYGMCVGSASIRAFTWGQGEEMITDLTCYVDTLSDNTENFAFQFGYSESQITNAPADGVFWQYSNGTNSGNWQIVSRNSAGSTNVYDIGTNVVARRWYDLRLKTATDGTSAAYLDGVLVQSGIAATSGQVIPLFRVNKAAGTTDRPMRVDYYRWSIRRATTKYQ